MKISIIGVGAMGGAIAEGLVKSGAVNADDITAAAPHQTTLTKFEQKGIAVTTNNKAAAQSADIIVIAVKPWLVKTVAEEINPVINADDQTIVMVAAGMKDDDLKTWFATKEGTPQIITVIPNIAIAFLQSMTFISPVNAQKETVDKIASLFSKMGMVLTVESNHLSAGTAVASCGIAYAMRYVRAAVEGSVELGFKASDAQQIVCQTLKGAVELLLQNGNNAEVEIDKVTTPGGITIKGLNTMEKNGFTNAVIEGLKASV